MVKLSSPNSDWSDWVYPLSDPLPLGLLLLLLPFLVCLQSGYGRVRCVPVNRNILRGRCEEFVSSLCEDEVFSMEPCEPLTCSTVSTPVSTTSCTSEVSGAIELPILEAAGVMISSTPSSLSSNLTISFNVQRDWLPWNWSLLKTNLPGVTRARESGTHTDWSSKPSRCLKTAEKQVNISRNICSLRLNRASTLERLSSRGRSWRHRRTPQSS